MSEARTISPLLDGFALGNPISEHDGVRCCPAIKENTDKKYIVKIISIPASQVQMDAFLLSGAFKDAEAVMVYFKQIGEDIMEEAQFLKNVSRLDGFLPYEGWQMEPIQKKRLGYEVYLVSSYKHSLEKYVRRNPMTHLEAINLGLDLCTALSVCRQAGSLYVDLKPSNIFISDKKEYKIGDLGFIPLDAMKYTAIPKKYCSDYTPPELHDPMATLNMSVDTYAVGMILYQLYNEGALPCFDSPVEDPIPAPANADYELSEIILKAIHPDPQQRWLDPAEMGQALVAYMQRNVVNDAPITPYTPLDVDAQDVRIPREEEPEESPDSEAEITADSIVKEILPSEAAEEATQQSEPEQDTPVLSDEELTADEPAIEQQQDASDPEEAVQPLSDTPEQEALPSDTESTVVREENTSDKGLASVAESPAEPATHSVSADEFSLVVEKADVLIAHETPSGVVLPELPEEEDPFAFATEDSIEAEDLKTPFDPVMETVPETPSKREKRMEKKFRSQRRKQRIKRFLSWVLLLLIIASIGIIGLWFYQFVYMQSIDSIDISGDTDRILVQVQTSADESLLTLTCSDGYGNTKTEQLKNGEAVFTGLIPNTMYKVEISIDGFHELVGQTSDVFTTDATTNIVSFTAITGTVDGSVNLNFTVDGEEPNVWAVVYSAEGEEERRQTFMDHSITIDGLTVGKRYTFTLETGDHHSLSGNTSLEFLSSRLILAENLTAKTSNGSDITISWTTPGDTVVDSWNVRCYNNSGYDEQLTVTDTEVHLTGIDPQFSYNVEVTASGMTQPARTSITANPLRITALNVDASKENSLAVSWEFGGTKPDEGWLLMYNVDGNSNLNVIKCDDAEAVITPKIPDAEYKFTVQSVDGTSIFDNVHTYVCPSAAPFEEHSLSADHIKMGTLKTPDEKNWRYDNLGSSVLTDQFTVGDGISLALQADTDFYLPGYTLNILYVFRDAYGNVMPDYVLEQKTHWKDIWTGGDYHYAELDIPSVPEKAGTYSLSLFFNGASVGQTTLTISE